MINLLYPPLCLECEGSIEEGDALFCPGCSTLFELLDPQNRCPYCFHPHEGEKQCSSCREKRGPRCRSAAAYEAIGPARSLIQALVCRNEPHLAEGASGALAVQFLKLQWKTPDWVVPVPIPLLNRWEKGYNPHELLASGVAALLQVPTLSCLHLALDEVHCKRGEAIRDKTILLVADQLTPLSLQCVEALQNECPGRIYRLAFSL